MNALSPATLERENVTYFGTRARSEENRSLGLRPAFMDTETGTVYPSCFADGRPAPFHLLDGLPDAVVLSRNTASRVQAVKPTIVSGFVLDRQFFTRDAAASWAERQYRTA